MCGIKLNVSTLTHSEQHETSAEVTVPFLCYKILSYKKEETSKPMTLLINQLLFSFEMTECAGFAEINMILVTITKAQVLSYDT